jgi:hypothetical protein
MVTHNPNLALGCDAEQIVHVHIDKENKNEATSNQVYRRLTQLTNLA